MLTLFVATSALHIITVEHQVCVVRVPDSNGPGIRELTTAQLLPQYREGSECLYLYLFTVSKGLQRTFPAVCSHRCVVRLFCQLLLSHLSPPYAHISFYYWFSLAWNLLLWEEWIHCSIVQWRENCTILYITHIFSPKMNFRKFTVKINFSGSLGILEMAFKTYEHCYDCYYQNICFYIDLKIT